MIKAYKLRSGEEIIGKQVDDSAQDGESFVVLKSVRQLIMQNMGQGQVSVAMIPWMIGVPDDEVIVYLSSVAGEPDGELPKQLEDGYLQQTSGLQLAASLDLAKK